MGTYTYNRRQGSHDPQHIFEALKTVQKIAPKIHGDITEFRMALQSYLHFSEGFAHEEEDRMDELADTEVRQSCEEMRQACLDLDKALAQFHRHSGKVK